MKQPPLVSIVIPVYNGANFLSKAIDSALQQTYENCEVIVVNDGSIDDGQTEKIALSYGSKIKYFATENGGISSALNYGIAHMSGEFFSWLSHDDVYNKEKISKQIKHTCLLGLPSDTIFMCGSGLIDAKDETIFHPEKKIVGLKNGREMFDIVCNGFPINGLSLLIPKTIFEKYGGFENYRYCQDAECWFRFMLNGVSFYCDTSEKLVYYRIHQGQTTNRIPKQYFVDRADIDRILYKIICDRGDIELLSSLYKKGVLTGDDDLLTLYPQNQKVVLDRKYRFLRYKGNALRKAKSLYSKVFKKYK